MNAFGGAVRTTGIAVFTFSLRLFQSIYPIGLDAQRILNEVGRQRGCLKWLRPIAIGSLLSFYSAGWAQPFPGVGGGGRGGTTNTGGLGGFGGRYIGETPMQYLTMWRMQLACNHPGETTWSTAAIAERVGYQSEAAFAKAFKNAVGTGPGAYRRERTKR